MKKLKIFLSMVVMLLVSGGVAFAVVQSINTDGTQNQTLQGSTHIGVSTSSGVHTLNFQGILGLANGGTGRSSFTSGSVLFSSGASISQDNSNLFWDDTNKRLGVGTKDPSNRVDVNGTIEATQVMTNSIVASGSNQSLSMNPTGTGKVLISSLVVNGLSSDPSGGEAGQIYFNTSTHKFKGYDGTEWETFAFMASQSVPTTLLSDNFNRTDQTNWGNASDGINTWTSGHDGVDGGTGSLIQIVSNRGRITGNSGQTTPTSYITSALSQQNNLKIAWKLNWVSGGGNATWFLGTKSSGNGNRNGVGLNLSSLGASTTVDLADNGTVKATTTFALTASTDYNLELYINTDYSMDLYIWASSGSKPGTPTLSSTAFTPGASGNKFQIGNSAADTTVVDVDDLSITSQ